jgi:pilus assembly protein CpaC
MNLKVPVWLAIAIVAGLGAGAARAAGDASVILVEQGTHKLHREPGGIARVAVGSPAVADVSLINRREVLITGKALGITSLMVWPKNTGAPKEYRVRVGAVKDPLRSGAPDPELAGALVDQGRGVEGRLPNLLAHRRAKIAAQSPKEGALADRSTIDLETQVMTEVKIAEVSRNTMRQYGLNFGVNKPNTTAGLFNPGGVSGVSGNQSTGYTLSSDAGFLPFREAFNIVVGDATRGILGVLSLLQQKGLVRVLAEPSLVAMSGQTASYLAGGEFPIPVVQGGSQAGGITIDYKEFGVRLKLTPTVLARDRIALKVAPEVSDLDFSAGIQSGGIAVPALTVRRTDTTVELGDGESFVISGLISTSLINNVDKVPWLADIPVLGAFFKSASVSRVEKELIMVVTPHLVRPMAREARLPPMPGAEYERYDPGMAEIIFMETGEFDSGFSR